jgi:hypothetical protein
MKITVTFDSLEEFSRHMGPLAVVQTETPVTPYHEELHAMAQEIAQSAPEEPEAPTVQPEPEEPATAATAPLTEDFRVEVRKTLAALNKATGKNSAKELIGTFGAGKLSEVALADLPALAKMAEEALHAV